MDTTNFGMQYEKNVTKLVFDIPWELDFYNKTIEFDLGNKKFTDIIIDNEYLIDNNVSCNLFVSFQVVFTDAEGHEVFKTFLNECIFQPSINAEEPAPTPEQVSEWNSLVTTLNQKIEEVDLANNINITATKEDKTATITITKADGTQEIFYIEDGADGKDGIDGKDGKDYIITEEDKKEIAEITEPLVERAIQPTIDEIIETSRHAENIARGRATGYVFDTLNDLDLWLQNSENKSKLVLGDNFYIRAVNVPDYWWDGIQKQQLEAEKPTLQDM